MQWVFNLLLGCLVEEHKQLRFGEVPIAVTQAPEPSDIIWENLVHSKQRKWRQRLLGWCLSKIVIGTFLIVLLYTAREQAMYSG